MAETTALDNPHGRMVSDSPEIDWPVSTSGLAAHESARYGTARGRLEPTDFKALRDLAGGYDCPPFTVCIAAYQFLLGSYCDQEAFGVTVETAPRRESDDLTTKGLRTGEIAVGVDLVVHDRFSSLLTAANAAMQARDVAPIKAHRAAIAYHDDTRREIDDDLSVTERAVDLHLSLRPGAGGLGLTFEGQKQLFSQAQLDTLATCYTRILRQVIADPEIPLGEIDLVAPEEASAMARRSISRAPLPACDSIPACFAMNAQSYPDEPAIETPVRSWSYGELDRETNALAHWLLAQGLREGDRLAVAMRRGTAVFRTWLAAVKAGLTVVPIDSEIPASRMRDILEDSRSDALIGVVTAQALGANDALLSLSFPTEAETEGFPVTPPPRLSTGLDSDAFVMFTSGTTGRPKSIPFSHIGVIRLVNSDILVPGGPGERIIQLASPGFDACFAEVWGSWLNGATLVLSEKHIFAEGGLEAEFRKLAPTIASIPTSLFNTLVDADPAIFRTLKHVSTGGEAASASHCRRALTANPSLTLLNIYGPTENGALTTAYRMSSEITGAVPIGTPIDNNDAFVLSSLLRPVPDGFAGELLVGGPGISRGYENRPDEAAAKFLSIPARDLGADGDDRLALYRTGDRARWNAAGQLEFLGRRDTQFKMHGHRIEPSEIESALMEHPRIGRVAVVPQSRPGTTLTTEIIAFFEPLDGEAPRDSDLRAFLETRLPRPILPTRYVAVPKIPLTPNGKADTRKLLNEHRAGDGETAASAMSDDPIVAIWQALLGRNKIPEGIDFYTLGGTSLSLVQMILDVEKLYAIDLDFTAFAANPTLRRLRFMVAESPCAHATGMRHLRVVRHGDPNLPPVVLMPLANGQTAWAIDLISEETIKNPVLALTFAAPQGDDIPPGCYSDLVDNLVADLAASEQAQPIILAGYSFGAGLAAHIAGHPKAGALDIAKLVSFDGASPVSALVPPAAAEEAEQVAFMNQFYSYPAAVVPVDCHLLRATRAFPYAAPKLGRDWSFLVTGAVMVYDLDTHHGSLTRPPFAKHTAKAFGDIIAGTARPTRVRESDHVRPRLAKLNRVKQLAHTGKPVAAIKILEAMFPDQGDIPDWVAVPLIQLLQNTRRREKLAGLKEFWPRFSSALIWGEIAQRPFGPRRTLLENCYELSGPQRSGALPLIDLYLKNGDAAEASAIIDSLRSSDRFQVEAGIAEALVVAEAGDPARACEMMQRALSAEDANVSHAIWCVLYFGRRGQFGEADTMVKSQRARFPDRMQMAQTTVQKMAATTDGA